MLGIFTSNPLKSIWNIEIRVRRNLIYNIEQILENVSIYKTRLPLKLHEGVKVLENLKSGHS